MKRYQDLRVKCASEQQAVTLWNNIISSCKELQSVYRVDPMEIGMMEFKKIQNIYTRTITGIDVRIVLTLLANQQRTEIYVANIVPTAVQSERLTMDEYNVTLNVFKENVIDVNLKNEIDTHCAMSAASYELKDLIPMSFSVFEKWMNQSPLSYHPYDMERWYDFVIAVHKNGEELAGEDLEKALQEDYHWRVEDANLFSEKLEDELELLKRYQNTH